MRSRGYQVCSVIADTASLKTQDSIRPPLSFIHAHLGELAALGAAMCWVFTSLAFAAAGRRIGPTAVNFIRIFLALAVLACVQRLLFGQWTPPISTRSLMLLGASGLIGLTIGDQFLFTALVYIGPRLTTLLMTLAQLFGKARTPS